MESVDSPSDDPRRTAARSAPDLSANLTIVLVALLALAAAWVLPWWVMKARAPQYGQRTLVVEVGPRDLGGDIREVDLLGHYVGIRPMVALAQIERRLAPLGMLAAAIGLIITPWLRRRWLRFVFVLPALIMPVIMLADLKLWMLKAVNDRDPEAALLLTNRINPKLLGAYDVGQFKVDAEFGAGFYLASLAGLLSLGLGFATPLERPRRWTAARHTAAQQAATRHAIVLLAVTGVVMGSRSAEAEQWIVGEGVDSIIQAVSIARDGDSVIVPPGVHREHVTLDRRVRLEGRPGAIIDAGGEGTALRITAAGVEVRGLVVRNSGSTYTSEDAGIRIEHAPDVRIVNTRVEDTLFGIFVAQGDRCVIEGCTVIGQDLPHVRRGDGIRLWYSSDCRIVGNDVERSRDVVIWYSSGTVVEDNLVRTSRYGLHYMYSDHNVFRRNRFEDNQVGAAVMYSRGIDLTENAFSFSDGPAAYGLLLKDADDIFIVGNRFIHNSTGLFFDNAPQSKDGRVDVHSNLVARNDVGLALQPLSQNIRFWQNALVGNRTQVQVLGSGSADRNLWAVDGRGNYWSDAVLYDADGDGVSEIPYRSENTYEALADRYPALAFFETTPAADAVDVAARLFPIFAPRPKLTDPHPLMQPPLTDWTRTASVVGSAAFIAAGGGMLVLAGFAMVAGRGARL
jgi:nitrous oxidase accessory protein